MREAIQGKGDREKSRKPEVVVVSVVKFCEENTMLEVGPKPLRYSFKIFLSFHVE